MLTPTHCDLFKQPFFQFAQLKQYCPERIEPLKSAYKNAWQDWRDVIVQAACELGEPFAPPHIERWCNGWQVRADFFAYFKYAQYENSAAILSVLLNRRRLTVSLDWHAYRANRSAYSLAQYNQWLDVLDKPTWGDFDIWHGNDDEYADYPQLATLPGNGLNLRDPNDFFCIGKHLARDDLANHNSLEFIVATIKQLLPLYEQIHIQAA